MKYILIAIIMALFPALPVASIAASDHAHPQPAPAPVAANAQMVEGLAKKIDKSAGKVTLSHGPLINLGMPAMTMAFRVKDAGWLDQMKEGDRIRFMADKVNGVFTVVRLEFAK